MAQRKTYFYKIVIEGGYGSLKEKFKTVFEQHLASGHLKLIEGDINNQRVVLDVIRDNENFLFCRMGKEKDRNSIMLRDNENLDASDLELRDNTSIEMFTHILLDYTTGILCYIMNKSAPSISVLKHVFTDYSDNAIMKQVSIPNNSAIRRLYTPDSAITSVTIDLPVPSPEYLENVLGFDRRLITAYRQTDIKKIRLSLFNEPRKAITTEQVGIRNILTTLENMKQNNEIVAGKVKGTPGQQLSQEYDLFSDLYSYKLTVNTYRIDNYKRDYFTLEELNQEIYNQMMAAYIGNREHLIEISDV